MGTFKWLTLCWQFLRREPVVVNFLENSTTRLLLATAFAKVDPCFTPHIPENIFLTKLINFVFI